MRGLAGRDAIPMVAWDAVRYTDCMTIQMAVRLPDEMVKEIDRLVEGGRYESRADAVRAALQQLLQDLREQQLDAAIVSGYERIPDVPADAWVTAAAEALVKEEPW